MLGRQGRTEVGFRGGKRPPRVVAVALLTVALAAAGAAMTAAEVHPFYVEALRDGQAAYERGDHAEAVERLEIACFGLLEEPRLLAAALVRLALARAVTGERQEFLSSFERLDEVESRFEAYSRADLPAALRREFEARVMEQVPSDRLRSSAGFARLVRNKELLRLQALPAGQRRAELERLVLEDPAEPSWKVMLAEAQVTSGDGREAIAVLEETLASGGPDVAIECLLGRAHLQAAQCAPALPHIESCDVRLLPLEELTQYVDCLTAAERWLEAASVIVSLPPEVRSRRPVSRREKSIARALPPEAEIEPLPPFEPPASAPTPTARGAAGESLAAGVARLRRELAAADTVPRMRQVATDAERLAQRFPSAPEPRFLAGEASYRVSDWRRAVDFLSAGGGPPDSRPELLFYLSVSLYELGDRESAAEVLRRALPSLERTSIVDRYLADILGEG